MRKRKEGVTRGQSKLIRDEEERRIVWTWPHTLFDVLFGGWIVADGEEEEEEVEKHVM